MATLRQKRLAEAIIESASMEKPARMQDLLEKAGYAKSTALSTPGREMERKGVQEELMKNGFDPDTAKNVVADILLKEKAKDKDKLTAADMIFKVHDTYAASKTVNLNIDLAAEGYAELSLIADGRNDQARAKVLASIYEEASDDGSATGNPNLQPSLQDQERAGDTT